MIVKFVLLFAAGIAAGFVNVAAGGGSLLTLPALIFFGLPPTVANGTNRIAVMMGSITSMAKFRQEGYFNPALGFKLAIPAVAGAILGSSLAIKMPDNVFRIVLSVVMLIVLALIIVRPRVAQPEGPLRTLTIGRQVVLLAAFFAVGVYGGFVQAGVGFIIITALSMLTGMSLLRINSLKVFAIAVYTLPSLAVFATAHKIDFAPGLVLAAGNGLGAWIGTIVSVKRGDRFIRALLIVAVLMMTAKVSGLWDWFAADVFGFGR